MTHAKICTQCGGTFSPEERFCPKDGTALRPQSATDGLIGQVIADRYQVIARLGEGGMGRVYLAEHVRMGRKCAVKVMSPDLALSSDAISRFNREASNASRINHPNVAQIYDFGETSDGMLYLAMEFVEGETLGAIIEREGALPGARAGRLTQQIADALGAAHHLGIVHRDLKPDNVMVAKHHDGTDWVKVVDFGIAKAVQRDAEGRGSQTVTTAGVSIGTPEYMSPEQLAGDRLDNRSDLYSLGLVLFNMLTGDLPYPRVTSKDTLVRRLTSSPRTLAEVAPDGEWPAALQAALDHALAPEPTDRYATVAEFGRDVMAASATMTAGDGAQFDTVELPGVSRASAPALSPTVAHATALHGSPEGTGVPRRRNSVIAWSAAGVAILAAVSFLALRDHEASPRVEVAAGDTAMRPQSRAPSQVLTPEESIPKTEPASVASAGATTPVVEKTSSAQPAEEKHAAPAAANTTKPASDTSAAASDEERIRKLGADLEAHFARANQFIGSGDAARARNEFREAASLAAVLHQLYGSSPSAIQIEQAIRARTIFTMSHCRAALADSVLKQKAQSNFRCEALLPANARGAGRGRGMRASGRGR